MSYAVVWSEDGGPLYAGGLEVGEGELRLAGTAAQAPDSRLAIGLGDLRMIHVERRPADRLRGRPTLVVEGRGGKLLRLACLGGAGTLLELADRLVQALPPAL